MPADHACYRYEYVVPDNVGNAATYTSPDIKVDTTAPRPRRPSPSPAFTNTSASSGTTVYYRPGAASGAFTATASATDGVSRDRQLRVPGAPRRAGPRPPAPSASRPTAERAQPDRAGRQPERHRDQQRGAARPRPAPSPSWPTHGAGGGTVTYTSGYYTTASVSVSFTAGTDGGSGVNAGLGGAPARHARRSPAAPAAASAASPRSPPNPTSPVRRHRRQHRQLLRVPLPDLRQRRQPGDLHERERRQGRHPGARRTRSASTSPVAAVLTGTHALLQGQRRRLVQAPRHAHRRRVRRRLGHLPGHRDHRLDARRRDASTPAGGPFTSARSAGRPPPATRPATRSAASTTPATPAASPLTFASDTTAPDGRQRQPTPNGVVNALSVPITTAERHRRQSGVNAGSGIVKRDAATLTTATETCGALPGHVRHHGDAGRRRRHRA